MIPHQLDAYQQQQADDRRAQLARYRAAYAERYGRHLDPVAHDAADEHLTDLLEGYRG